ncbi:MAG: acyl-CoA carboxylase subunit beta [Segniliparus sp.]|uniref:acyl-CoA carboxylase subunit beta n=1 Tax=Segniliparus sp. TaxID=2804064 RepID=UPI003F39F762
MVGIGSPVDFHAKSSQENYAHQQDLKKRLAEWRDHAISGGSERSKERHKARGKFLVRERIQKLLDPATPFFEIGQIVGEGVYDPPIPSAAIVTGIGYVNGSLVAIYANDATVKGGTYYPLTVDKTRRVQELARELGIPSVYLVDSGGVNVQMQDGVFPQTLGAVFRNIAQMSALQLPQIGAVLGSCTAAGAYIPAMCDETVITDKLGTIFLGGPELVEAATGIAVDAETLGGAALHAKQSGVVDHVGATEEDSLLTVRAILDRNVAKRSPEAPPFAPRQPRYDINDLPYLIPVNPTRKQMDMFDILARIVDDSQIVEYKAQYGTSLICATARISGYPVGILANNGILYEDSAAKGANFIEICSQRGIPLLYLHDINGFMIGEKYEASGIARQGAKMITAVSTASVPKIVLMLGNSYGAGHIAMCGRFLDPLVMGAWPTVKGGAVGAEQGGAVMAMMYTKQVLASGNPAPTEEELAQLKRPIEEALNEVGSAKKLASLLMVDDIVLPEETRDWLTTALQLATLVPAEKPNFGIFRM